MADDLVLPPRLALRGRAMQPRWQKIHTEICREATPSHTPCDDMAETVMRHRDALTAFMTRIDREINRLTVKVVGQEDASDAQVHHAVAHFEALLDDVLNGHAEVCALDVHGRDAEARELLAGIYRQLLMDIRNWLEDLVRTLADPLAELRRRGQPTTGPVEIALPLHLNTAPEINALRDWMEKETALQIHAPSRTTGLGFWGTVGAMVLGIGIGEALFGGDD